MSTRAYPSPGSILSGSGSKNEHDQGFVGYCSDVPHRSLQQQRATDRIFFDTDGSTVREDGRQTLNRQAEWLKKYPNYQITIEGHCDERGTREYNLALGERRANAARQYLIAQGIPAARLKTVSYGKERPDPVGSDEAAWSRNRRAVTALE